MARQRSPDGEEDEDDDDRGRRPGATRRDENQGKNAKGTCALIGFRLLAFHALIISHPILVCLHSSHTGIAGQFVYEISRSADLCEGMHAVENSSSLHAYTCILLRTTCHACLFFFLLSAIACDTCSLFAGCRWFDRSAS